MYSGNGGDVAGTTPQPFNSSRVEYDGNPYSWSPVRLRYSAHSLTKQPLFWQFFNSDLLPEIQKLADIYRQSTSDKLIVLANEENDDVVTVPYFTRFSSEYSELVRRKLRKLEPVLRKYRKFHFLTLTVNPRMFSSLSGAYSYLQSLWNKVLTRLRKRHPGIFIIKTVEMQKNGYPHLHVLISGIGFLPRSWLLKTEEMGLQFYYSRYLEGYGYRGALNYILKYILKGSSDDSEWGYVQKVIQWALFSRTYSTSRLSLIPVKNNSNGDPDDPSWFILGYLNVRVLEHEILTRDDYWYEKNREFT